jgi:hypothetical protein
MHVPINVKSPNNTSKWQMGFNSAFKGLITRNEEENNRNLFKILFRNNLQGQRELQLESEKEVVAMLNWAPFEMKL